MKRWMGLLKVDRNENRVARWNFSLQASYQPLAVEEKKGQISRRAVGGGQADALAGGSFSKPSPYDARC